VLGEIRLGTGAGGEIAFTLPAAGMYFVSSRWPAPGPAGQTPPRRLSYAATVEVLPQ